MGNNMRTQVLLLLVGIYLLFDRGGMAPVVNILGAGIIIISICKNKLQRKIENNKGGRK